MGILVRHGSVIQGLGFRVKDLGLRVWGSGFYIFLGRALVYLSYSFYHDTRRKAQVAR